MKITSVQLRIRSLDINVRPGVLVFTCCNTSHTSAASITSKVSRLWPVGQLQRPTSLRPTPGQRRNQVQTPSVQRTALGLIEGTRRIGSDTPLLASVLVVPVSLRIEVQLRVR
jgi:hypothetical protein